MDVLADSLNALKVAEVKGKRQARIRPASKVVRNVLLILQKNGYVGEFKFIDDGKSGEFIVTLTGRINNARSIKPRFAVSKGNWEKFETRFLPSKGVGVIVVSTSQGIMSHVEAQEKNIGGRLLCFVY
ncbi:TPA: 30S ribosomal protein S8 [Candidatus Micrarchaeota archaeon]|nr:30S ribosomal protein S8 [uncultured archaeon]HIH19699.1 30S ribosomal protein S8 [Candidatus Micrarchaeota archaeon]